MKLTLGQIADWMRAEGDFATAQEVAGYSIDSRTIGAGELFFAVKGERLDGHEFVQAALDNGATAAVVSMGWLAPDEMDAAKLLRLPDGEDCVLRGMQTLAHAVRKHWGKRVVGVTGSAGKTTTKEAVAQVLGARIKVMKSAGNLNNAFGLPLQLLKLEPEHEVAVIEMGMNHAGEIAALAKIAEPDWGVVSNVAPVHLEMFADGIAGIARAKYELIEALPEGGFAFLNADDEYVSRFGERCRAKAVSFGVADAADVRAESIHEAGEDGMRFTVVAKGQSGAEHSGAEQSRAQLSEDVKLALMGRHNVYNALAAIAVGLQSGMTLRECTRAIEGLQPADKRGEVLHWREATLVNDCYNSNPLALNAMVDALQAVKATRRIVVAGEMLELGPQSGALHAACGQHMGERGINVVVGVRGFAREIVEAARAYGSEALFVETPEAAGAWLGQNLQAGDAVLLKASRGVRLERALQAMGKEAD